MGILGCQSPGVGEWNLRAVRSCRAAYRAGVLGMGGSEGALFLTCVAINADRAGGRGAYPSRRLLPSVIGRFGNVGRDSVCTSVSGWGRLQGSAEGRQKARIKMATADEIAAAEHEVVEALREQRVLRKVAPAPAASDASADGPTLPPPRPPPPGTGRTAPLRPPPPPGATRPAPPLPQAARR